MAVASNPAVSTLNDAATRVDKDLIARAYKKVANGQELSSEELEDAQREIGCRFGDPSEDDQPPNGL